jgi:proteasome alpha subunit
MDSTRQQAYDRASAMFSPDGRLYQVEYAREAVGRGAACLGVTTADGVVLAGRRRLRSPLFDPESVEKIHEITDGIGIASAGHVADARQLVDLARRTAGGEQLRYGEGIGVETLTKAITDHVQEYTQVGGARPFGASLLIGGIDHDGPALYEADPGGTPGRWQATAIGSGRPAIQSVLESEYSTDLELDEGVSLALRALSASADDPLTPKELALATVGDGLRLFSLDERRQTLAEIGS